MIRLAGDNDLPRLQEIERAAGAPFRGIDMTAIAEDEPPSLTELAQFADDGRAWVSVDELDRPIAYLLIEVVDGDAHIEQVSVHPDHAHQGIGRTLIETAMLWAQQRKMAALTLTTFTDVPWNGPYYERLGFRVIPDADLADGLRRIRQAETARGLDRWPRMAMQRPAYLSDARR